MESAWIYLHVCVCVFVYTCVLELVHESVIPIDYFSVFPSAAACVCVLVKDEILSVTFAN